jgi:hypothetical protein
MYEYLMCLQTGLIHSKTSEMISLNLRLQDLNKQEEEDKKAVYSNNPIYKEAVDQLPAIQTGISSKENLIKPTTK